MTNYRCPTLLPVEHFRPGTATSPRQSPWSWIFTSQANHFFRRFRLWTMLNTTTGVNNTGGACQPFLTYNIPIGTFKVSTWFISSCYVHVTCFWHTFHNVISMQLFPSSITAYVIHVCPYKQYAILYPVNIFSFDFFCWRSNWLNLFFTSLQVLSTCSLVVWLIYNRCKVRKNSVFKSSTFLLLPYW